VRIKARRMRSLSSDEAILIFNGDNANQGFFLVDGFPSWKMKRECQTNHLVEVFSYLMVIMQIKDFFKSRVSP